MAKTLAEITAEISKPWDGPTDMKGKFAYIPWEAAQKEAIRIFDVDGYDIAVINPPVYASQLDEETGKLTHGYQATVRVTVYPSDGRPFSRDGVGYTAITRYNSGDVGLMPAIKGSVSAALVRALTLIGYHFGLTLYEGEDTVSGAPQATPKARTTTSGGGKDIRPSVNQLKMLHDWGYTDAQVDAMDFDTWKNGVIQNHFDGNPVAVAPANTPTPRKTATRKTAPSRAAADEDDDGFPF